MMSQRFAPQGFFVAIGLLVLLRVVGAEKPPAVVDLSKVPSPQILPGTLANSYRDPAALYHEGVFRLWFTVNQPRDDAKRMVSFLGTTRSKDLVRWEPVKLITPEDPALNYSSPGNIIRFQGEWILCFQTYPIRGRGFIGDQTARLFIMRSKDLVSWSKPELLKVKGPDVPVEKMGRMIDPYLLEDKDQPGKWWCFYKQSGVSMSYTHDFKTWQYHGRTRSGENVTVLVKDDEYIIMHSPGSDGMGLLASKDLKSFRDYIPGRIKLGYGQWPWAAARLTAGTLLDLTRDPRVGKYIMFYHGAQRIPGRHKHIGACSLGVAWSDDLKTWRWPGGALIGGHRRDHHRCRVHPSRLRLSRNLRHVKSRTAETLRGIRACGSLRHPIPRTNVRGISRSLQ